MKLNEIGVKVVRETFVIHDETEHKCFDGFWNSDGSPAWKCDLHHNFTDTFVSQDNLPAMSSKKDCEINFEKIKAFYMNLDGECEGIFIKKAKLLRTEKFTLEVEK